MNTKQRVLFLCTGNSARSQMAEAFLRRHGGEKFDVCSAGLVPKGVHPFTKQVMAEAGYALEGHTSKDVKTFLGTTLIHIIITVCDHAEKNCPTTWPGVLKRLHWHFDDPAAFEGSEEAQLAKFREVRDQIEAAILAWLKEQT